MSGSSQPRVPGPPGYTGPPVGFQLPPPGNNLPPRLPPPSFTSSGNSLSAPFTIPPPSFASAYESSAAVISAGPQLNTSASNSPAAGSPVSSVTASSTSSSTTVSTTAVASSTVMTSASALTSSTHSSSKTSSSSKSDSSSKEKKLWTEHTAPNERTYYYNTKTKQSSWEKPDELKTPAEILLSQCPWKEYKAENGKTYYYNVDTKESRWNIPKELEELKQKIKVEEVQVQNEEEKSALDAAMAATLAAIEVPKDEKVASVEMSPKKEEEKKPPPATTDPKQFVFKDKREALEAFKEFLREKGVPGDATWDKAVRIIQSDPRYDAFSKWAEKKQAFNAYKVQRAKEEKEEQRLKSKKAKEDLEEFLLSNERMSSSIKYYRCHEMYQALEVWKSVPEHERRDIYDDVIFSLAKKEKEENKTMRKRNMKVLSEILDSMTNITFKTTWNEAQQMLIDNSVFAVDTDLLSMDKEDALIVFAEHIKQLEEEEEEEREREKKRIKRQQRKCRDNFSALLDELHDQGKLTSMSLWVELYPVISSDVRFSAMLGQPGSTPLDLFKFYVADLKSRFHDEKKIIKEILKEKNFEVQSKTNFMEFAECVCDDKRSATLDAGNVKLTYNALIEKAEAREIERQKEEARQMKRLEAAFRVALKGANVDTESTWDEVRARLQTSKAFTDITIEAERIRIFKEYQQHLEEACGHHHSRSKKKSKKKEKKRSPSPSSYSSESDDGYKRRKSRKSRSSSSSEDSDEEKRKRKKKSRKRKGRSRSASGSSEDSFRSRRSSKKKKKKGHSASPQSRRRRSKTSSKERDSSQKSSEPEAGEVSLEEGELSEDELEKKRERLMKELENI